MKWGAQNYNLIYWLFDFHPFDRTFLVAATAALTRLTVMTFNLTPIRLCGRRYNCVWNVQKKEKKNSKKEEFVTFQYRAMKIQADAICLPLGGVNVARWVAFVRVERRRSIVLSTPKSKHYLRVFHMKNYNKRAITWNIHKSTLPLEYRIDIMVRWHWGNRKVNNTRMRQPIVHAYLTNNESYRREKKYVSMKLIARARLNILMHRGFPIRDKISVKILRRKNISCHG